MSGGYGSFRGPGGKTTHAHRAAYELLIGPVPAGLHLDHLCRTPACVNPLHLEPVTNQVNTLRGEGAGAICFRRNACAAGHEFTVENTYYTRDGRRRQCRACHNANEKRNRVNRTLRTASSE